MRDGTSLGCKLIRYTELVNRQRPLRAFRPALVLLLVGF
jgi:hypothetical protein